MKFSSKEALAFGWTKFKENWILILLVGLVMGLLSGVPVIINDRSAVLSFIFTVVQFVAGIGLLKIYLFLTDGESVQVADLFRSWRLGLNYFFGGLVAGFLTLIPAIPAVLLGLAAILVGDDLLPFKVGGAILAIIIFAVSEVAVIVKLQFWSWAMVDKNLGPVEAVKKSLEITEGSVGDLLLFNFLLLGVNLLGVLVFFIGLFVSVPVTILATAFVYRKLAS